ncbi:elongation factor Ts [Candidatus Uhrbacteria bacterium]|nr:elongation factor Ts [Candidatus Uhrbacteria bacterium]
MIDPKLVTTLRTQTGAGIVDCKKALEEANGNYEQAVEFLRKKGQKVAANKQDRSTKEGLILSYIHPNGKVGVLVELLCETDFVARTDEFKDFAHDIALQIAAMNPLYVRTEEVPAELIEKEKEIYRDQMVGEKKPPEILEKILTGKVAKYYQEVCLLKQQFVKDDSQTVEQLLTQMIAKTGENIQIHRFSRFAL